MPNTSNRAYTYPDSLTSFRPHLDIQELATDVDADVEAVDTKLSQPPICILRASAIQAVANNGAALTWNTEDVDTAGIHSTSVNPTRITPNIAGYWQFTATTQFASNTTGRRGAGIRKNGTDVHYGTITAAGTGVQGSTATVMLQMNGSTDYVESWGFQESGGSINTHTDLNSTRLEARLVYRS